MSSFKVTYSDIGSHKVEAPDVETAAKKAPPEFNPVQPGPVEVDVSVQPGKQLKVKWTYIGSRSDGPGRPLLDNWRPEVLG